MADTTTISDLTEKQTLVDTDKILVEDTNGVGQALLGSAISDKINGALANYMPKNESSIDQTNDLNNVVTEGHYTCYPLNQIPNVPTTTDTYGVLIVHKSSVYILQEISTPTHKWQRIKTQSSWTNWEKLVTESDLTSYKKSIKTTLYLDKGANSNFDISNLPIANTYLLKIGSGNGTVWRYCGILCRSNQYPSLVQLDKGARLSVTLVDLNTINIKNDDTNYTCNLNIEIL